MMLATSAHISLAKVVVASPTFKDPMGQYNPTMYLQEGKLCEQLSDYYIGVNWKETSEHILLIFSFIMTSLLKKIRKNTVLSLQRPTIIPKCQCNQWFQILRTDFF